MIRNPKIQKQAAKAFVLPKDATGSDILARLFGMYQELAKI